MKLSIGITSFKYRFEKYLIPLINSIKKNDNEIEIILAINGENREQFDDTYRRNLLKFIANKKNVFPMVYTEFRGLSKLWNSIMINSTGDYTLVLNDDTLITDKNFINDVRSLIEKRQTSFKLNRSWSHVVLKKIEYLDIGMCDERMLGIGEDDAMLEWLYEDLYKKPFANEYINAIYNFVDMTHNPTNTRVISQGKYSKLNQELFYNHLFEISDNGIQMGLCPAPLVKKFIPMTQAFYEKFYLENRDKL